MTDIDDIINRLKKAFDVTSNIKLSEKLKQKPKTLEGWLYRKRIPIDKIIDILVENQISLDWILYGKKEEQETRTSFNSKTSMEFKILNNIRKLDPLRVEYYYHKTSADVIEAKLEQVS
jgi:hypothetical protein